MGTPTYFRIQAVYHDGVLNLLQPLDLPEGARVQVDVQPLPSAPGQPETGGSYPSRFISAERLSALTAIVAVGGDALVDSEALYDLDWD